MRNRVALYLLCLALRIACTNTHTSIAFYYNICNTNIISVIGQYYGLRQRYSYLNSIIDWCSFFFIGLYQTDNISGKKTKNISSLVEFTYFECRQRYPDIIGIIRDRKNANI